ncbi:GNAT family N-acetyltransferase [Costertonia aggregata]|uniref:GNAT family N-acetyltransferase n=1 Tax=Costertonia aggregata TaxID=343403 RepID=A0A7H9AK01_9FLAO|nr:GNAT family protein [Costertonia aggregata]QLG43872.1 GNAT family N-acetyltransferase [Costertonia aggregata]
MLTLKGDTIFLRALEPGDLNFLYELENDPSIWEISNTITPYSKKVLKSYLENAHRDIYDVKQLRLCICTKTDNTVIGLIDLFDFDPKNHRAGLGLIISNPNNRNKGVGAEAISLVCDYAFSSLQLKQVYANILMDNNASIHLFEKMGFEKVGFKKDWIFFNGTYKTEILYQKIKN